MGKTAKKKEDKGIGRIGKRNAVFGCAGFTVFMICGFLVLLYKAFNSDEDAQSQPLSKVRRNESEEVRIQSTEWRHYKNPGGDYNDYVYLGSNVEQWVHDKHGPETAAFFSQSVTIEYMLHIATSVVTYVTVKGSSMWARPEYYDYFTDQFPVDSIVMLCDKKTFDCLICNSFNFDFYEAVEVNCTNEESVAVNLVTVKTFSMIVDHISTSAKVFGKEVIGNAIRELDKRKELDAFYSGRYEMERVFDEGLDRYCYHYADDETYPAQVEIPWSFVTHVLLRAASSEIDNKIEGIWIDVCTHGGSCLPCGVATLTPAGKEIEVYCLGGGIHGNEVQLRHGYDELYYCKVKIYGDMMEKGDDVINALELLYFTYSRNFLADGDREVTFDYLQNRYPDENFMYTYWAQGEIRCTKTRNHLTFEFQLAAVRYVQLFQTLSPRTSLRNVSIEVCETKGVNCGLCGMNNLEWIAAWMTVYCPKGGLMGTYLTLRHIQGQYLEICGIEIYGTPK